MENVIVVLLLLCIVGGVIAYLCRAKNRGQTCIGCPCSGKCGGSCHGGCEHTEPNPTDS